jgi:hypothetical protein
MFFFSYIFVTVNQKTFYKFKTVTKMKKMIFTAMAVVLLNTVVFADSNVFKKTFAVGSVDCYGFAMDYTTYFTSIRTLTATETETFYNLTLNNCLREQKQFTAN